MTTKELTAIADAQQTTNRLLVLLATRGLKQKEAIALLDRARLPPKEIAQLLGTTANTVSVALAGIRKLSKARKSNRTSTDANES